MSLGKNYQHFSYADFGAQPYYPKEVKVVISPDPSEYGSIITFENVSDKLVRITYRDKIEFLEPKEIVHIKVHSGLDAELPVVTPLNNGVS